MVPLYLFAEGQTEQTFAGSVLGPHLANLGVFLEKPVLIAHARKKGKTLRGGGRKYGPIKKDILRFTARQTGWDVFFTTMIDLYGIPKDFPGLADAEKHRHQPYDRVHALEKAWFDDIDDRRFIPYIQLHEYEACLFTKPDEFSLFYDGAGKPIEKLEAVARSKKSPELIDDGQHSAPSKRIIKLFPDYGKAKAAIGPQIGARIGIDVIRGKCPHFHNWLETLEDLGRGPGNESSDQSGKVE